VFGPTRTYGNCNGYQGTAYVSNKYCEDNWGNYTIWYCLHYSDDFTKYYDSSINYIASYNFGYLAWNITLGYNDTPKDTFGPSKVLGNRNGYQNTGNSNGYVEGNYRNYILYGIV